MGVPILIPLNVNSGFLCFGFNLVLKTLNYRGKLNIFLSVPDFGLIFESTSLLWPGYIVSDIRNVLYCTGCYSIILRGFCPSCHAKRREEWAEWMREKLLLDVPHRQVVFTIPKMLMKLTPCCIRNMEDRCQSSRS